MITGLCDEFPKTLGKHRELFVLTLLGGIFLCCLPTCTYVSVDCDNGLSCHVVMSGRQGPGGHAQHVRLLQPDLVCRLC